MITINERTSCLVEFDLIDQAGNPVAASALSTFTITLYNRPAFAEPSATTIINSRDHQNALNVNSVTVSPTGHVVWNYGADDGAIVDDTQDRERHIALFEAEWNFGLYGLTYEVVFDVVNMRRTP
jgi:hypothetical protein